MGGAPELVDEGKTGEMFDAGNADELEMKIRKIIGSSEDNWRYAANCLQRAFENPESYYQKLMDIYGDKL